MSAIIHIVFEVGKLTDYVIIVIPFYNLERLIFGV